MLKGPGEENKSFRSEKGKGRNFSQQRKGGGVSDRGTDLKCKSVFKATISQSGMAVGEIQWFSGEPDKYQILPWGMEEGTGG